MTSGNITTVANVAVEIPIVVDHPNGIRLLGRAANTSDTFVFFTATKDNITTAIPSTRYNLLPIGAPATSLPYTIPGEHFKNGRAYIISTADGMIFDWAGG